MMATSLIHEICSSRINDELELLNAPSKLAFVGFYSALVTRCLELNLIAEAMSLSETLTDFLRDMNKILDAEKENTTL